MKILHLSFDHPDRINTDKTKAVKNLYSSYHDASHTVLSMNRTTGFWKDLRPLKESHGYSMRVVGLPFGILLRLWMYLAYRQTLKIIENEAIRPDLIHAHKLSFEGLIAYRLSVRLGIPFILTVRGNTDLKVIRIRRDLRPLFRRIITRSRILVFLAPWTMRSMEKYFSPSRFLSRSYLIPNIVRLQNSHGTSESSSGRFVSVFRMQSLRIKNAKRIIQAFDSLFESYPSLGLDIIGSGPEENNLKRMIGESPYAEKYRILGRIDNRELVDMLPGYTGFILPSFPETFGIVFIEALGAGIPVIYSKGSGIDGYFDSFRFGERVFHRSVEQIRTAIKRITDENALYRKEIERLRASGALKEFTEEAVGKKYADAVRRALLEHDP